MSAEDSIKQCAWTFLMRYIGNETVGLYRLSLPGRIIIPNQPWIIQIFWFSLFPISTTQQPYAEYSP